jgi:zinc protease
MSIRPLLGAVLSLLLFTVALPPRDAAALTLPDGVEAVTEVEGISEYRLANGLRVLLFPDASKPTVTVNITYLVGSRQENYGETGMAHLLEHLLFKGTPTHADIRGEMRRRGISFNASTSLDRTNYYASFAAEPTTLDWMLALEADRMLHSRVAREDLDSEMTVVRNEMEARENNPVAMLRERMTSVAHLWHNYGNSPIGARADVETMPIERLQAFYRRHYRPDNATLLVAGRIDPASTLATIAANFGPLARPDTALEPTYTREPPQDGEREVTVRRVGETHYLGLLYHAPSARHPDFAALAVLADVLGDTPGGRLHKALVEGKLANWVAAGAMPLDEPGHLVFFAEAPKDADPGTLQAQLLAGVEQLAAQPVSAEEVADAQRRFARAFELTINDANRLAMDLSESIALGDWRLFFLRRDLLEAVTAEDVNRVATTYLQRNNRTLGRFEPSAAPQRVEIAEAPPAAELVADYRGRAAVAAGEAFDPTPAAIDARTRTLTLANGTRLVLLPKTTRGSTVVMNMSLRFADEASVLGKSEAASFAASLLMRGSRERSREDIARRLEELRSTLGFGGGTQTVSASATSTREQLPAVLALAAELLQQPAFPASEFEQLRTQAITAIESAMTEPQTVAGNALARHFNPWPAGHPYYAASFDEQLSALRALTLDEVRAFHAAFYGAGDGEITLVGDFDPDAVQAQLEALFGGWTRPQPFVRIPQPHHPVEAERLRFETPDKANAVLMLRADLALSDSHPDYPALLIAAQVLGGGSKSRLFERIREREGLSYTVSAQFSANAQDERATLMMYAIAAPQNVAAVEAGVREEFARLLADGIEEAELRDAVDGLLKARERGRGEDPTLAAQLRGNAYLDRTMAWSAELDDKLRALDTATVAAALQRQFAPLQLSVFSAGDFAKAAAATP